MKKILSNLSGIFVLQIAIYLFINTIFLLKYLSRVSSHSTEASILYAVFVLAGFFVFKAYQHKIPEKVFKISFWIVLIIVVLAIAGLLIYIDKYAVRVDRWSAVVYFLDALFRGEYPYGAHTHVSETNFPSPFPVWYLINLPFYLMGETGIGLIFFLLLTAFSVKVFFGSYRKSFLFLILILISPAYWWEVAVRSDSLSNVFLIFAFIIWFDRKKYSLANNFWLCVLACGLLASTRFSAMIPLALLFFKPYVYLPWQKKILFPIAVLGIIVLTFSPFIFWDTDTWIFFQRNPFMSQASVGNIYLLLAMVAIGCFAAFRWKNTAEYFNIASLFMFGFILLSQISLIVTRGVDGHIFDDSLYDISYFTLALPYCCAVLVAQSFKNDK